MLVLKMALILLLKFLILCVLDINFVDSLPTINKSETLSQYFIVWFVFK